MTWLGPHPGECQEGNGAQIFVVWGLLRIEHPLVPAPPWSVLLECPLIPAFIYLVSKKECDCIQMTASFIWQGNDHHHVT